MRKRSNEPVFWALFGAGGVLAALAAPALILLTGLAIPLGLVAPDRFSFSRMQALVSSVPGSLALFLVISLFLWHAMHRINHSLHDFGIEAGLAGKFICYGFALLATIATALMLNLGFQATA